MNWEQSTVEDSRMRAKSGAGRSRNRQAGSVVFSGVLERFNGRWRNLGFDEGWVLRRIQDRDPAQ